MKVRLRLLWHPQAQFAGALIAQHHNIASTHGITLECQPVDYNEDPISAVLKGNADLCVASPSHLFESDNPEELLFLLNFQQASPVIFLARRDRGISDIRSLSGHRVAVWPGKEHLEFLWMLQKSGISSDSIEFVQTADTVQHLLDGDVSCAQMTTYNEYFEFIDQGGNPDDVVTFLPGDFGCDLIKDGIIAHRDWVEENPEPTQSVVNSLLEGWTRALQNQEEALELCTQLRPDMSLQRHLAQYEEIKKLILCDATFKHGLGYPDMKRVDRAANAVHDIAGRKPMQNNEFCADSNFWRAAPSQFRSTEWS